MRPGRRLDAVTWEAMPECLLYVENDNRVEIDKVHDGADYVADGTITIESVTDSAGATVGAGYPISGSYVSVYGKYEAILPASVPIEVDKRYEVKAKVVSAGTGYVGVWHLAAIASKRRK